MSQQALDLRSGPQSPLILAADESMRHALMQYSDHPIHHPRTPGLIVTKVLPRAAKSRKIPSQHGKCTGIADAAIIASGHFAAALISYKVKVAHFCSYLFLPF